jgi:hypothetical protein
MMKEMSDSHQAQTTYRIRVRGGMDASWSDWFAGVRIRACGNGESMLTAELPDQAALHGMLRRIRDLGLPLISIETVPDGEEEKR